jgi:hypothetical protein
VVDPEDLSLGRAMEGEREQVQRLQHVEGQEGEGWPPPRRPPISARVPSITSSHD